MLPIGKVAVAGADTVRPPYCVCTMLNNLRISGRITQLKYSLYTYTPIRRVPWYETSAMGHLSMKMKPLWPCGCAAAARQCRTEHLRLCTSRATSIRRVLFDTVMYYILCDTIKNVIHRIWKQGESPFFMSIKSRSSVGHVVLEWSGLLPLNKGGDLVFMAHLTVPIR